MITDKVSYDVIIVIEKLESTYDMTNITLFILPNCLAMTNMLDTTVCVISQTDNPVA